MPRKTKSLKSIKKKTKRPASRLASTGRFRNHTSPTMEKKHLGSDSLGTKKPNQKMAALILLLFGIGLMSFSGLHFYLKYKSLHLARNQIALASEDLAVRLPLPVQITIKGKVNSAIEPMNLVGNMWGVSDSKTNFLQQSARPGEAGNIILYGHNKPSILTNLHQVVINDVIILTAANGSLHHYRVHKRTVVNPDEVSLLQPTPNETLTIYTCTGFLDSKRLIIQAQPL